jgi:four helix bundle protein
MKAILLSCARLVLPPPLPLAQVVAIVVVLGYREDFEPQKTHKTHKTQKAQKTRGVKQTQSTESTENKKTQKTQSAEQTQSTNFMTQFQERLKQLMDEYVHFVYDGTRNFPKEELYSSVSQWRRGTLSIILNYIEGYARKKSLVQLNFYEISYGSLKESKYLLNFSLKRKFITEIEYQNGLKLAEEIGKMLWSELTKLQEAQKIQKA